MKELGNLAIICATRTNTLLQILNGEVTVFVGTGPEKAALSAAWHDDERICKMIYELNYGKYAERKDGSDG